MAEQTKKTVEQTKKTERATEKVYKFKSSNKFLSCVALGVQFIDGTATTANLEVAKRLVNIAGVEMIED